MNDDKWAVLIAACFLVVVGLIVWYGAGVEARTYNRITGNNVTQWEALFVSLRVDCN